MSQDPAVTAFQAQLQTRLSSASTDAQAQIYAKTKVDVTQARVGQGAQAAVLLAQNGYNPDNPDDNAKLIHVIAGGLCLVPGVGPVLGAAVEGLWATGNAIGCPVERAFASIGLGTPSPACGGQVCATGGNWTASGILQSQSSLPNMDKGTFAAIAMPALATYAAQNLNCQGGMPPGVIVDACAGIWNVTHEGPPVDYFVPPLGMFVMGGAPVIIPMWDNVSNSYTNNVDPNIYFAFQPVSSILAADGGIDPLYFPAAGLLTGGTQARKISLNSGAMISLNGTPSPSSTEHPAVTVAKHASVIAAGGVAGGLLYAWVSGKAVEPVFMGAWNILSNWVTGGLTAVERATGPLALGAGESRNLVRGRRGRRNRARRRHAASKR